MKTLTDYKNLSPEEKGAVIALGNFDGLHRGHQAVIHAAKDRAKALGAPLAVGVFRPHPVLFFKPDTPPFRLMSAALRARTLVDLGVDFLYEIPFNAALRDMDDRQFVDHVLHDGLGARHIMVGEDYGFGKNRCGNAESLTRLCAKHSIDVSALDLVGLHRFYGKYGSTDIRKAVKDGDVFHAAHMLSRPFIVDGTIIQGEQRGRTIGFPTANLDFGDYVRPRFGVYAVEIRLSGENEEARAGDKRGKTPWYPAIANTGKRPTVGGEAARLEVHIFNFERDIYGEEVEVAFRSFIRPETKFENFYALKAQIAKDCLGARAIFGI